MKSTVILYSMLVLTACATIMHGTSQDVGISSSPTGATVTIDNQAPAQTPYIAHLSRKDHHIVKLAMPGYAPADLTLTRKTSGWVWGNIVFGGIIGLAVDAMTGGLYNLTPEQLNATLAANQAVLPTTKDGIFVILVPAAQKGWMKVGQLKALEESAPGE